jgi:hypothetical protein
MEQGGVQAANATISAQPRRHAAAPRWFTSEAGVGSAEETGAIHVGCARGRREKFAVVGGRTRR